MFRERSPSLVVFTFFNAFFKKLLVVVFDLIQILIEQYVRKQWRPLSEAVFCGV